MNVLLQTSERTLVSLDAEELLGITNALNEVCHGVDIAENEFQTRLGVTREFLARVFSTLTADVPLSHSGSELVEVWEDHGAVMVRAVSVCGDPVEMGETQSAEFAEQLKNAIARAT